jgi:hypothetical protein
MILIALCISGSLCAGVLQKSADVEAAIKQCTLPNTSAVHALVVNRLEPLANKHAPRLVKKMPADFFIALINRIEALSLDHQSDSVALSDIVLELNAHIAELYADKSVVHRLYYRLLDRIRELANAKLSQDSARIAESRK